MAMDEQLLSRRAPQSLEAEQAVLGSILIDSRCITDIIGIVKPEDFLALPSKKWGIVYVGRLQSFVGLPQPQ